MSGYKQSRKQLLEEPDEFLSLSQKVWLWAHENQGRAAAIVGGVAAVLLIGILGREYVQRGRERRAAELARAVDRYLGFKDGAPVPADVPRQLEELAARESGSVDGAVARYFAAGALATQGEAAKAAGAFDQVARDPGGKGGADLAPLARLAQGYLALAGGDADGALARFEELLKAPGTVVPRAQLKMEIAAILEKKGRTGEARDIYAEVEKSFPDGSFAAKAKERLRLLDERGKTAA